MESPSSALKKQTILLLTYYYQQADQDVPLLQHIISRFCGAYLPFDIYLDKPLRGAFGQVIRYDFLRRRAELGLRAMNAEVLALVKERRPQYVLWTSFYDDIRQATLADIRRAGSTIVGWFFDDEWRFHPYSKYWIPYLDYCVTNSLSVAPAYRRLGARVIQTIPNTGAAVEVDWLALEEKRDLAFVGRVGGPMDRLLHFAELTANQLPVSLFGEGAGGYIPFEQMLDIFRTTKINLNFSKAVDDRGSLQIKGRVFQVCLAGGFLLTEYAPGLEKYFELNREIACFESRQEMVEKVRYYLSHDAERRAIARAGWERAKANYSSEIMVARVFEEIHEDRLQQTENSRPHLWLWKTMPARRVLSNYHMVWARAQMERDDGRMLWRDDLKLALSQNPGFALAWLLRIVPALSPSARISVLRTIDGMNKKPFGFTVVVAVTFWLLLKSLIFRMTQIRVWRTASRRRDLRG